MLAVAPVKVLVVDTHAVDHQEWLHRLRAAGFEATFTRAEDVAASVARERPDLVVVEKHAAGVTEQLPQDTQVALLQVDTLDDVMRVGSWLGTAAARLAPTPAQDGPPRDAGLEMDFQDPRLLAGLGTVFDVTSQGLAILDQDLRYVRVNQVMSLIHHVPADAHVGKTPAEVLGHPPWLLPVEDGLRRVLRYGQSVHDLDVRGEISAKPGNLRTWRFNLHPWFLAGVVSGVVVMVREVTREQLTEESLARALDRERDARAESEAMEERLAFLYQVSSTLFSAPLDRRTRMQRLAQILVPSLADWCLVEMVDESRLRQRVAAVHWSPQVEELSHFLLGSAGYVDEGATAGFSRVLSRGEAEFVPDAVLARTADAEHQRLITTLKVRSYIIAPLQRGTGPSGAVMLAFSESNRRYREEDLAMVEDLCKRAALAIENARLFQEAERAIRARDDLLSIASHDVRAPLSSLGLLAAGLLKRIRKNQVTPDQVVATIEKIEAQSAKAVALLDDLLSVVRIAAGKMDLRLGDVDLGALVQEVVGRSQELLTTAGCRVDLRVDGAVVGRWDHLRLEQVTTNLLSNAMKYGRGKPIEVHAAVDGDVARLKIRDEGIGISPEDQRRIFDRFGRATERGRQESYGLGLWIVRQIVTALGGKVWVESKVGSGSTFTVELPLSGPNGSFA